MSGKKGRSGRRPIPTEVKRAKGTLRKHREIAAKLPGAVELSFPVSRLEPPAWLDDVGRKEWGRVVPLLEAARVLTDPDLFALASYCSTLSLAVRAREIYQREGLMKKPARGSKEGRRPHPMIKIAQEATAQCLRFAQEFGFTPAARSRIAAPPMPPAGVPAAAPTAPKAVDDSEAFLFHPPLTLVKP